MEFASDFANVSDAGNVSVVYSYANNSVTSFGSHGNKSDLNCSEIMEGKSGPPPIYDPARRYIISGILFIFPCLTMIGNGMVIVAVLTHKRLKTVTNAFVVSLAVADIMVAILVMPFGIYQQFNNKTWNLGKNWCLITTSFDVMFTTTSIFNLSCLAIDRYLAICRPFIHERLTRPKVIMMLSFCWIVPIFISFVPIHMNWNHIGIEDYVQCAFPEDDPTHCAFVVNREFATVCSMIAFYIPTVFIVICNVHIFRTARKQAHQIRSLELSAHKHHRKGKLKHETKAAKTVGIIMGCFFICWFPFFGLNIIDPFIGYKVPYTLWTVALWLGYINSMLNPFLYYNFNRHYKMAFRRLLTCKVCRGISEFEADMVPSTLYTDLSHSASANSHSCLHNGAGRHSIPQGHINNNVDL
ncbi:5-hydroxytryptamine receptor 4-like [Ruditapes philippinarum]|uniref:5-hydroxytryptamine receptor 4-like n=1 Tax=Ruditapes philippinarum TaxID=129788 RepID=UPI00295B95FC|nr:5-hydroxytryptamine receptor 4-like [Ruditapes philippinarum]